MPLKVKLEKQVADGVWSAVGNLNTSDGKEGPAEVLFQQTGENKLKLMLNSKLKVSTIMNREVNLYSNVKEVEVKKIEAGAEVEISTFWFSVSKQK